jgi:hypothetical protein
MYTDKAKCAIEEGGRNWKVKQQFFFGAMSIVRAGKMRSHDCSAAGNGMCVSDLLVLDRRHHVAATLIRCSILDTAPPIFMDSCIVCK